MTRNFVRYTAKRLEELAKLDPVSINQKVTRKKLRRTIRHAEATNRPDRAEWASILLIKFSQGIKQEGNE